MKYSEHTGIFLSISLTVKSFKKELPVVKVILLQWLIIYWSYQNNVAFTKQVYMFTI